MAIKHVVAAWLGTGSRHDGSLGWSAGGVDQGCNRDFSSVRRNGVQCRYIPFALTHRGIWPIAEEAD